MFFEGSLQEGISTALQESKQVICFVTDDGSESKQWEDEFLTDESIRPGLENQSVVLRLPAGSEEAGYLEALFPIPKKPTIVVIQNGQLKEYIASGTSKEEFIRRLGKSNQPSAAIGQPVLSSPRLASMSAVNTPQSEQSALPQSSGGNDDTLYDDDDVQPAFTPVSSSIPTPVAQSATPEDEKRVSDKKKGKAKAEPEDDARKTPEKTRANELKVRRQQANEERRRILKRIEDDKRARKEREADERNARRLLSMNTDVESVGSHKEPSRSSRSLPSAEQGDHCNLLVRLLDGSTIRNRFPRDKTLGQDVRKWIDEERTDGNAPYSFRVVLTPMPNKVVEPQEEIKSLLSLGFVPSATLVLIPTKYSAAYARTGGVLTPVIDGFSFIYTTLSALLGRIFALIFGGGGNTDPRSQDNIPMENLRGRSESQLYNGNSLNFEPNEDDDERNTR